MQRILLYDLKLESYVYHSTPCPSMEGVVVAGYHSAIGDKVTLTDRLIDWRHYDIIYIIGDNESLVYDPEWLGDSRVVPLGKAFGNHNAYDPKWEQYPLNSGLKNGRRNIQNTIQKECLIFTFHITS